MHIAERLLLYATAICAGVLLLFGEGVSSDPGSKSANKNPIGTSQSSDSPLPTPGKSEIVLHDQLGRARIIIKVAEDGRPSLVLKGDGGQDALTAEAANDGSARVFIGSPGRHAELKLDAAGNSALELVNGEQGKLTVTNARDGTQSVSLSGEAGLPMARLSRDLHGNAELRMGSAENRPAMTLAATRAGELQVEFLGSAGSRGQMMFSDTGSAEISLAGRSGPASVMRAESSGAEIAIRGTGRGTVALRTEGTRTPRFVIMDSTGKTLVTLPVGILGTEKNEGKSSEK